jgi:hypothetical protein
MSESTTATAAVSTPNAEQAPARFEPTMEQLGDMAAKLAHIPDLARLWPGLCTGHRKGLAHDAAYVVLGDGLDWAEYAEGIAEWLAGGNSVAEYLAEQWFPGPAGNVWAQPGSHLEAAKAWQAVAEQEAKPAAAQDATHATPADAEAAKAAQDAQQAQAKRDEEQAAGHRECQGLLVALVKAYAKGESAYRDGLLDSGRIVAQYIARRIGLGATRKAAVQTVEGQLAAVATDTVDANRLARCWAAWHLLAEQPGLAKQAAKVPYGHYRDAWCKLVDRAKPDTAEEHYTLLPGLEAECLAAFGQAVANTLDKQACHDRAQALVREHAGRVAKAHADAKAKADADAKAAQEQAAAQHDASRAADEQARKADEQARQAEVAAQAEDDAQAKAEAQATAEAARVEAMRLRAEAEHQRFAEEQAARELSRTKAEQKRAADLQAQAEAAKAKLDAKAKQQADKAAGKPAAKPDQTPKPASPVATGEPRIDPKAWADKPAKDVAGFLAELVTRHGHPDQVLAELVDLLASFPAGKPFATLGTSYRVLKAAHKALHEAAPAPAAKPAAA